MMAGSLVSSILMLLFPKYFYSRNGKIVYFIYFFFLSLSAGLRLYFLHGYVRLYYSHLIVLELVFVFICSTVCS